MPPVDSTELQRYKCTSKTKSDGVNYTPKALADFVAKEIVASSESILSKDQIHVFDPAVGRGQLLDSLLALLPRNSNQQVIVHGCETDEESLIFATQYISQKHKHATIDIQHIDFLAHAAEYYNANKQHSLFKYNEKTRYDIIIANPPYVRTQILGSDKSKQLASEFGLGGRVDLYHAFIVGISAVLSSEGISGIITSNRFITTKSGFATRKALSEKFNLLKLWDLGDTKIFDAAVLPAVILVRGTGAGSVSKIPFTTIYSSNGDVHQQADDPIQALQLHGLVKIKDGRVFKVQHGILASLNHSDDVWRIATDSNDEWLSTVQAHTWKLFGDIGKIRVGVKTTADKVFIRTDWNSATNNVTPELLRPLITHHNARRFKSQSVNKQRFILYPHEVKAGIRRAVDLSLYPNTEKYLTTYKHVLEARKYVIDAGRKWYEIWVPQDPNAWDQEKLIFRDISEKPTFWIDKSGGVVNGDCYWLICDKNYPDLIWLAAAIANSTFIEKFYDYSFCNKLYSGRRRFITQYVEKFPLPDPQSIIAKEIIKTAKRIYDLMDIDDTSDMQVQLDNLVTISFGLSSEKIPR